MPAQAPDSATPSPENGPSGLAAAVGVRMGAIALPLPMMQAGLAGYSDRAMRLVARRRGCPYAVTEAILDTILLSGGKGLRNSIDINDEDHPVAGQVMGSDAETVAPAAQILAAHGYDTIDLNFACPVKKVKNKARGGWMLMDVGRGVSILRGVREALPGHPLSLSLRRGFDDTAESEDRFWRLCEAARGLGYVAIRVHGRTVEQKYAGRSRRPFLADVKRAFPDWVVWGSGDVFEPEDVVDMLAETGVDGVWIARGAIGNPWIFRDAAALLAGRKDEGKEVRDENRRSQASSPSHHLAPLPPPTVAEQREALEEHFAIAMEIHGESLAGRRMRKIGIKYARFHPEAPAVKARFIAVKSLADWQGVLATFYADDRPGVRPPRGAADEVNEDASCEPAEA